MVLLKRKSRLSGRLFLFLKRLLNRCPLMFCGTCTVSDRKDTKLLKAIHNGQGDADRLRCTVSDRKDTKLLKAIHN